MPRKKVIKEHRIRITDHEAWILRIGLLEIIRNEEVYAYAPQIIKKANKLYARLTHLKPGPPKGIPIKKSEAGKVEALGRRIL